MQTPTLKVFNASFTAARLLFAADGHRCALLNTAEQDSGAAKAGLSEI